MDPSLLLDLRNQRAMRDAEERYLREPEGEEFNQEEIDE